MTLQTAVEFTSPSSEVFTFYGWTSITSSAKAAQKSVVPLNGGVQDAYFFGLVNETTLSFDILSTDPASVYTDTAMYKAIVFETAIRESEQLSASNWTVKIFYNTYTETETPTEIEDNPSTWRCKLSAFTWTSKAGEHLQKVNAQVIINLDNVS